MSFTSFKLCIAPVAAKLTSNRVHPAFFPAVHQLHTTGATICRNDLGNMKHKKMELSHKCKRGDNSCI